jgi:trk system potassium uptake protein TrkH
MMRQAQFLRDRYRAILGYTGYAWALAGLFMLLPLLVLPFYPQEWRLAWGYLLPGVVLVMGGYWLGRRLTPPGVIAITLPEGAVIVLATWLTAVAVGALPLMLVHNLDPTLALFESTSGWTTTGLSVIDVSQAPFTLLFYRSLIQFAGGAGFAIIMLTILAGTAGAGFSGAEGRSDQLEPHARRSAAIVLRLYFGYAAIGVIGLRLAGMNWFDAVNHALTALSTGGFSTRVDSIGYWDSPLIEAVVIVLMLLGTTNFLISHNLLQGRFRAVARASEPHLTLILLIVFIPLLFFGATWGLYATVGKAARVAIFEVVSAMSTTGFATVSYTNWPSFGWLALILLMIMGGGSGSTAGGIKQYRIYLLLKGLWWEIRRLFLPRTAVTEPYMWRLDERQFLGDREIRQAAMYVALHLLAFVLLSGVMAAHGYGLPETLFETASSLSTVGLSVGVTAADAPPLMLWAQIAAMFLGRLEFLVVIAGAVKLVQDGRVLLRRS